MVRKEEQKKRKEWDNVEAREGRVGGWRDFMAGPYIQPSLVESDISL